MAPLSHIKTLPRIYTNYRLNPDPATADSPEGCIAKFLNCVQLDTGRVIEESLDEVGSRFSPGAVTNYNHHLWYILIRLHQKKVDTLKSSE